MKRSATSVTGLTPAGGAAAEQVIATLPTPLLGDNPLVQGIMIDAVLNMTGGTSASNQTFRVRRTNLAGTQVGPSITSGAANAVNLPIQILDGPPTPNPPPAQYVITSQQTGASTNGTVTYLAASATAA